MTGHFVNHVLAQPSGVFISHLMLLAVSFRLHASARMYLHEGLLYKYSPLSAAAGSPSSALLQCANAACVSTFDPELLALSVLVYSFFFFLRMLNSIENNH